VATVLFKLPSLTILGHVPYQYFIPLLQISTVHVYLTYPFVLIRSLLEPMSAGCAIVASDTQPLREAIVHNETGKLVDLFMLQLWLLVCVSCLAMLKKEKDWAPMPEPLHRLTTTYKVCACPSGWLGLSN
jgi:hypothetical protein